MLGPSFAVLVALIASLAVAQLPPTPSSWPQDYPGKPSGDFSPDWQSCTPPPFPLAVVLHPLTRTHVTAFPDFQVTDALPNVTWTLPRSFAGNIPVNRAGHANNTLFFWGFEHENGSLTAAAGERSDVPWAIWLNGGYVRQRGPTPGPSQLSRSRVPDVFSMSLFIFRPGSSSMLGQAYEVRLSFALKWECHPAAILTLTSGASRSTEWPGAPERGRPPGPEPVQLGQARGLHLD